jgi:peptidoglycan/xylan/chitin deacetylase (PgdA/CDA1 family)
MDFEPWRGLMLVGKLARRLRTSPIVWVFHDVVDRAWFERCIGVISSDCDVLPLAEIVGKPELRHACAVTFDDGLRSALEVAHPVLKSAGFPYTVFVCTEVLQGGPVPWFLRIEHLTNCLGLDPVRQQWKLGRKYGGERQAISALKQVPLDAILAGLDDLEARFAIVPPDPQTIFLGPEDIRELSRAGTAIGSHTHRHPILSLLSARDQRFEIEESARVIEGLTGTKPREFAYPNGTALDFDQTTIDILRENGFRVAVTTTQQRLSGREDLLALPRIGLSSGDSPLRQVVKSLAPSISLGQVRERSVRKQARTSRSIVSSR